MGYMQRSAGKVKIAGLSIDRRSNSRGAETPKKFDDVLKRKSQAISETKSQLSEQGEVKKRKPNLDALDKLAEDTIETNYGFGKQLQALEKEVSEYEEKIQSISKQRETLLLDQKQLGEAFRKSSDSKLSEVLQPLDTHISASIGKNTEQLQNLRKLRKEKLSHIQKFNTERDKYRNQYKTLLDLYKSHFAVESTQKSADKQSSEQNHEVNQIKTQLSDQKVLNIPNTILDEMAEKTQYAVEQTYGFNNRIHILEQEKASEKEKHEKELHKLQQEEEKRSSERDKFVEAFDVISKLKHVTFQKYIDDLKKYIEATNIELEKYKKDKENLIHKFDTNQKKKEDSIKELNKERNDCLKRHTDHIFGLYKSTFVINNADKLASDQFKRDMLIASTTVLSNMNFRSSNGLGELIKNILKSVLEGKL
jgi:DNA repair exonuclease SbcCD ATPase subunit